MKATIIILLSLFHLFNFQTENYYIIKIKGDIYNETAGKKLQQGDAVKASDKLTFRQKDAMAMVISDSRGRFTLKYPVEKENHDNALYVFVKTALVMNKQNQLSTRSIGISSTVSNLNNYFGQDVFNIIGNNLQVKLSKKYYPLSEGYNIVAEFIRNGQKVIKKLNTHNQIIDLSREGFGLKSSGEVYLPHVKIYKVKTQSEHKVLISETNFRFIDKAQLNKELVTIIDKLYDGNKPELQNLLIGYFKDVYGKTDEIILSQYVYNLTNKQTEE